MVLKEIVVTAQQPFPTLAVTEPNRRYASILLQDIASAHGELTAITQYLYQHWVMEPLDPDFAKLLERIAVVEMHHLDMLGRLVVLLGGNPLLRTNPCNCNSAWNSNLLQYRGSYKQILTMNIAAELGAFKEYTAQAELIRDPLVSAVLLRIAQDEEVHCRIFRSLLEQAD